MYVFKGVVLVLLLAIEGFAHPILFTAPQIPKAKRAKSKCFKRYSEFYKNPKVTIQIVFGYKDARPARFVGDRYERAMFVRKLQRACGRSPVCGFQRDTDDGDWFSKTIQGPDGKPRLIRLNIAHSSIGPDDDENRNSAYQKWLSQYTEATFVDSFKNADVIFYDGHSREGGGPDFFAPKLANKNIDVTWYRKNRPGWTTLEKAVSGEIRTNLLGMFSCLSTGHFSDQIKKKQNQLGQISSRNLVYYADALENMEGALSALLGMWCESDFASALKGEAIGNSPILTNFF